MKPVLIAGGGIGGLTLANCLQRTGIPYLVLENAPKFFAAGYAIGLGHNAMECLGKINPDLQRRIQDIGVDNSFTFTSGDTGKPFYSIEHVGEYTKYGTTGFVSMSRQNLQKELLKDIPESSFRLNSRVTSFEQDSNQVVATLSNGDKIEGSLLVGSDGLRSSIRENLHEKYAEELGPSPKVEFTNFSTYGGVSTINLSEIELEKDFSWLFADNRLGAMFPMKIEGNEATVFWSVGMAMDEPVGQIEMKETDREFLKDLASPFHEKYHYNHLIENASKFVTWDLYHLARPDTYSRWGHGNVTLLGDAAHAVTPWVGQGAGISVEDAYDLTVRLCDNPSDYPTAIEAYEKQRIPRATFIFNTAVQNYKTISWLLNPKLAPFAKIFYRLLKISTLDRRAVAKSILGYNDPSVPLQAKQMQ